MSEYRVGREPLAAFGLTVRIRVPHAGWKAEELSLQPMGVVKRKQRLEDQLPAARPCDPRGNLPSGYRLRPVFIAFG